MTTKEKFVMKDTIGRIHESQNGYSMTITEKRVMSDYQCEDRTIFTYSYDSIMDEQDKTFAIRFTLKVIGEREIVNKIEETIAGS